MRILGGPLKKLCGPSVEKGVDYRPQVGHGALWWAAARQAFLVSLKIRISGKNFIKII